MSQPSKSINRDLTAGPLGAGLIASLAITFALMTADQRVRER